MLAGGGERGSGGKPGTGGGGAGGDDDPNFRALGLRLNKKWTTLALLVVQTTAQVLLMRYSRVVTGGGPPYLVSTAVVTSEALKVATSWALLRSEGVPTARIADELRKWDTVRLAVPGVLYLIQNNLLFVALSNLDAAVYQVTYQLKTLTTAAFSVGMLGKRLSQAQMVSLLVLTGGVALVQLSELDGRRPPPPPSAPAQDPLLGLACVLLASVSSGYAGVYTERMIKERNVSLWIRNIPLGSYGVVFGLGGILLSPADRGKIASGGFFQGYNRVVVTVVVVQALGGLLVAAVMKYADNILKGFATSVSIVLSCLLSVWIFSFQVTSTYLVGSALVTGAVVMYNSRAAPPPPRANV